MYNYPSFKLDNFEGPLELLYYLIQNDEIDPCGVVIKQLTSQLIQTLSNSEVYPNNLKNWHLEQRESSRAPNANSSGYLGIDISCEMAHLTAILLLIKSQKLLPREDQSIEVQEEDPRLEMIKELMEYCRFKDMAKNLAKKEEEQRAYFPRPPIIFKKDLGTGLEEMDHERLKMLLKNVLEKAAKLSPQVIREDQWQVADKIHWLKQIVQPQFKYHFEDIFLPSMGREELIVSFLALLELMKLHYLKIVRESGNLYIVTYESIP